MVDLIKEKYDLAPSDPGVYLMKDSRGRIIYVGKAKNLKKRLASYFARGTGHDPKTSLLVDSIADFDIIITSTEHEALILEATLIKKHRPKYNVFLKDGKNYPCFRIDTLQNYPVLQVVRNIKSDRATYFGPYSSGYSVKQTLKQVNRIFKLRKCRDTQFRNRSRPCIQFQIKACLGPCCNDVPVESYSKIVSDVTLFLKGRAPDLIRQLKQEMVYEAEQEQFEKAAQIRDTISAIEKSLEQQIAVSADMMDRDVVACAGERGRAVVTLLFVRSGYVVGTEHHHFEMNWSSTSQIIEAFLKQYYREGRFIPPQILVAEDFEDRVLLEETLALAKGQKVNILMPERGDKRRIVEMAIHNSQRELETSISRNSQNRETLTELQRLLGMENYPERIECFDNSHIAGRDPVSSMVVFINGEPEKSMYRKFMIRNMVGNDDYASMTEVLTRRFSRSRHSVKDKIGMDKQPASPEDNNHSSVDHNPALMDNSFMELPDLLVVDGGRGQLSMATAVLSELELTLSESEELESARSGAAQPGLMRRIKVVGLAKKDGDKGETHDKVYLPGRSNPVNMTQSPQALKALYLLQRLRDEAHRFAITFQKKQRAVRGETSLLDGITGIGKKRKAVLLNHFKGVSAMRKATVEEIAALPGISKPVAEELVRVVRESR